MAKRDYSRGRNQGSTRDIDAYKRDLERLFQNNGQVPERFQGIVDQLQPEEGSEEAAWSAEVARLREAEQEGFRAFVTAATAFVAAGHRLPDDEDLLIRLLDHPGEKVIRAALQHLIDLHDRTTLTRLVPLRARLGTVETVSESPLTLRLVRQLRAAIG